MNEMVGYTLQERAVLLHRMMPQVKISSTTLSRIYRANGIKKKVIRKIKKIPDKSKIYHREQVEYC